MNPRPTSSSRRLRATLWAAISALLPATVSAESIVFNADFSGSANTVSQTPSVITPQGATWYGAYNKPNGALSVDAFGLTITGNSSSSAAINVAGRVTQAPINLAAVGDYIEFSGSFYTDGLTNLAFGLFNSGGVDPLATLLNNGLAGTTATGGGTFGWTGYRAMSLNGSLNADFKARQAQTGTANASYELLSPGTGGYGSPGAIGTGTGVNSATSVAWNDTDGFSLFGFVFRITRTGADTLAFTHTIRNEDTDTVLYSASGVTNTASQPSTITSAFDSVAFGGRVNSTPFLQLLSAKVVALNADIAKIDTQPVDQNIAEAGSGSITVGASGAGTLSYQWYRNGSPISGATSATYNISGASSGTHGGDYHVVVSNAHGYEVSDTVAVNVAPVSIPVITQEPVSHAVDAGTELTLSVEATGVPTPTYQWYHNDEPIPDATLATYTVGYATEANAGPYKVVVTNTQGSDTSATATITINTAAPDITTQPTPVTVNVGAAINLTAAASGLPAPSYQWYHNDDPIPDATAASYSIPSATTANAGNYKVVATNTYGFDTSDSVLVTVNVVLPALDLQPPAALTVHQGQRLTLNATYTGSLPRTYQWYQGTDPIPGATGTTYTIPAASASDSGTYHVVVTNEGGNTPSANSVVTVVGTSETTVFSTDFATDTKNDSATPITSGSTSWFILSGRDATNCSVGDDPATTEVVETRPLTVTWVGTAGSAIVETAARFSPTPVALGTVGDYLNLRATLSGTNLRTLCFGLYDSHGVSPLVLDSSNAGSILSANLTDAVGLGTQNWTGYRSSLTIGNSGGDIGTRPAQTGTTSNRGQELLFPAGSTGAAFGEPAGVSVSTNPSNGSNTVPGVGGTIALNNSTTYTLDYTITLSATNQYTISYSLYEGASATGTPLYTTNAVTSTAGARPADVATGFDSLAIGLRNNDNLTSPTLVVTNLAVTKGVAAAIGEDDPYDTWASAKGLTVGVNDGATQDPDGDGINNLLEFVLGGEPLSSSGAILPVVAKDGANYTFTFNVQVAAYADYDIYAETSPDLAIWNEAVDDVGGVNIDVTPLNGTTDHVVVTVPSAGARTFVRLKVEPKP